MCDVVLTSMNVLQSAYFVPDGKNNSNAYNPHFRFFIFFSAVSISKGLFQDLNHEG